MKYFLDSAKINEIREAYDTFGIDGVTTNPNHIMLSGKPFKEVLKDMVEFVEEKDIVGYEKFPISVEINPHLDDVDEMVAMALRSLPCATTLSSRSLVHSPVSRPQEFWRKRVSEPM